MRARQRVLVLLPAAVVLLGLMGGAAIAAHHAARHSRAHGAAGSTSLPVAAMEKALGAQGTISNGDLSVEIDRTDIDDVTINRVPIKPAFEINGSLDFQPLAGHQALFNGDIALKPGEINPVIDAIISNGLVFQAEHQHMYDFSPIVWFIHIRGKGDAVKLAAKVHNVVAATATPLPQAPPSNPTTPLDASRLQSILHGFDASVGENGVVTVFVARRNPEYINGFRVNPATNIATNIAFEPLNSAGTQAAVIPDFGMVANEINTVVGTMRSMGWDIGCLYNQETAEQPQLFFSHEFKTGDPYALAREVRRGLDQTNSQ